MKKKVNKIEFGRSEKGSFNGTRQPRLSDFFSSPLLSDQTVGARVKKFQLRPTGFR